MLAFRTKLLNVFAENEDKEWIGSQLARDISRHIDYRAIVDYVLDINWYVKTLRLGDVGLPGLVLPHQAGVDARPLGEFRHVDEVEIVEHGNDKKSGHKENA